MIRTTIAALMLACLAGCGTVDPCEQRSDYKNVNETRSIVVPETLDRLQDDEKLVIPAASTPPDVDTSCLEKPPRFFAEGAEQEGEGGDR